MEVLFKSVKCDEKPDYSNDCKLIPEQAIYMKLVMGHVVDYFRPVQGYNYCAMLLSYYRHQWSPNGINWSIPRYYGNHLGGSARGFPNDGRQYLSFWGSKDDTGGCCSDRGAWKQSFRLYYSIGNYG